MERHLENKNLPKDEREILCSLLGPVEKDGFKRDALWQRVEKIVDLLMRNKLTQRNRLTVLAFYAVCEGHTNSIKAQLQKIEELLEKQKGIIS